MADFGLLEVKSPVEPESGHTMTVIFIHGINGHRIDSWASLNGSEPSEPADLANTIEQILSGEAIEESKDDNHEDTETPDPVDTIEVPPETDIVANAREEEEANQEAAEDTPTIPGENGETVECGPQKGPVTLRVADLLASKIPNACIMTYGYDFGASTSQQDIMSKAWIQQAARKLLEALWAGQEGSSGNRIDTTPLIFVCHDLGGVILKEMLWLANNERLHLPIAIRTQLLVFFGTPHKESTVSPWEDLVFDIALASTELRRESRRHILTAVIKAGAGGVRDASERFNQLVGQYRTLNFFACKPSSTTGSVVVPEICATANWPLEEHFARDVDHLSMCRLSDPEDPALLPLCTRIEAVTGKAFQASFDTRRTFSTRSPQRNWPILPPTEAATVQWIITNESVASWLASETFSILHIHGRAGSGKTVFAASMEKYLQGAGSEYGSTAVISFSFDRSSYRGRSFSNMLESLIQELLSQSPAVDIALVTIHEQIMELPSAGENPIWTQEALCLMFSAAVDIFEHPILCIVDGIQHCDETRDDMLQYLVRLGCERTGAPFKVALTSRESLMGLLVDLENAEPERSLFTVELDNEQVVHDERHRVIKIRLADYLASAVTSIPAEDVETVVEKFCSLSLTFLEVDLIIKRLQAQLPTLASVINLRHALDKLASNSSAPLPLIFEGALSFDVGAQDDWHFVERVIPWLIYSEEPLTLNQLAVVQSLEEEMNSFSAAGLESLRSKDIPGILQRTLGSLVVIDGDKVVFLHDSALEFLVKHARLGASARDAAKVHSRIASKCLDYLNSAELAEHYSFVNNSCSPQLVLPESASGAYDFLTYAAHHWPTHQRLASRGGDVDNLFQKFTVFAGGEYRLHWWHELYHYLETDSLVSKVAAKTGALYPGTALNIASFFGLEPEVKRLLTTRGDSESEAGLQTSLEVAAWNNYADVVRSIVSYCLSAYSEAGWDTRNTAMRSACRVGNDEIVRILLGAKPAADLELNACLQIACGAGHPRVVVLLVEAGADVNTTDDTKKTPLHHAAETGYYRVIRQILSLGADLSAADDDGYTALHLAAMNGHLTAVRVLLAQPGSDINTVRWSIKPLHLAAKNGHVTLVKELLKQGAEYSVADAEGSTPLHMAAAGGFSKTMKLLLDQGADAGATNKSGQTPLHLATGSLKAVKLLLDHGADPDAATYDTRRRPLHVAVAGGQLSALRLLLDCGATVDPPLQDSKVTPLLLAVWHEEPQCLEALLEAGANPHWKCGDWTEVHSHANETTALHLAWGHAGMTEILLRYSTDEAHAVNAMGRTPFYYAFSSRKLEPSRLLLQLNPGSLNEVDENGWHVVHNASQSGSLEFLKLMLEYGADLNVAEQETGSTPLRVATIAEEPETVRWLIENGADINVPDENMWSLLHFAANEVQLEIIQILVEAGGNVNAVDNNGVSPLHLAARNKDGVGCVRYLLEHGANVNLIAKDDNWSVAHYAACAGELESLKILTDAGAEVSIFDKYGWAPLHRACQSGSLECVQYLLEKGVDLQARDTNLLSPLTASTFGGNQELLKLLFEKGLQVDERDSEQWTPLVAAAVNGFVEGARFLLDQGADIEARTILGDTPLMHATEEGKVEMIKFLRERGADIQTRNNEGQSLMHKAAIVKGEHAIDIIQMLLDVGLALDERDQAGRTLLFRSAAASAVEVTRFLLEKGVDKEAVDEIGRKAIDVCLTHETRTVLGWCLEEGATLATCTNGTVTGQTNQSATCDVAAVCESQPMTNDFWYHCCACMNDEYVICIPCYDSGARCENPEEHTLLLRYLGQGLKSIEEYSPWVKLRTLPKELEK